MGKTLDDYAEELGISRATLCNCLKEIRKHNVYPMPLGRTKRKRYDSIRSEELAIVRVLATSLRHTHHEILQFPYQRACTVTGNVPKKYRPGFKAGLEILKQAGFMFYGDASRASLLAYTHQVPFLFITPIQAIIPADAARMYCIYEDPKLPLLQGVHGRFTMPSMLLHGHHGALHREAVRKDLPCIDYRDPEFPDKVRRQIYGT